MIAARRLAQGTKFSQMHVLFCDANIHVTGKRKNGTKGLKFPTTATMVNGEGSRAKSACCELFRGIITF